MMKLKQVKDDYDFSLLFKISESLVSKLIILLKFVYYQFKEIDFWACNYVIQEHMPSGFKAMFPLTRVIVDATEIPVVKPQTLE